jgi:hypothetical protein
MENYEFVSKVVKDYSPAVTFFLAAYIFLLLCRLGRGCYDVRGREYEFYLYYVSGRLFFVGLIYVTLLSLSENLDLHLPPSFEDLVADLNNDLLAIDRMDDKFYFLHHRSFYFEAAVVLCMIWGYVVIRSIARKLAPVFQLKPPLHMWNLYSGEKKIRKDIIAALILSSVVISSALMAATYLFGIGSALLERFRI